MNLVVEGVFRRRYEKGFGPFRSEYWEDEPFRWEHDVLSDPFGQYQEVLDGLKLSVERHANRVFIHAKALTTTFMLGDVDIQEERLMQFSILSLARVEINGRIVCTPTIRTVRSDPKQWPETG